MFVVANQLARAMSHEGVKATGCAATACGPSSQWPQPATLLHAQHCLLLRRASKTPVQAAPAQPVIWHRGYDNTLVTPLGQER